MDVFNAFKGTAGMIWDAIAETMPRQAVVTRSEGDGVWVRFTPVNASKPEMWFPSTVAGLPAGTAGWVHPLAGGKGRFIATGQRYYTQAEVDAMIAASTPIPFSDSESRRIETTSITNFAWTSAGSISVPAGTYRAVGMAIMPMARSVASGIIHGAFQVNNVDQVGSFNVGGNGWGPARPYEFFTRGLAFNLTVTTSGTITFQYGVRGETTAGTTYLHRPQMTGTLTRIG